ncbi:NAD(P)/FAD-dependent oxidoreductase [Lipingzhangella sp. LS1_29]|uniref:NAD(P)/FAD-dependent oxidoreductase n=1 Tax=Lipingzhangella rawalii TaxID=2055835 RepID=A0ABU2HB95_9ACTN|nr:NAD(P)/FAD-dependent oxidoreductase [Lipingzhangella rawalii]MDS1272563.1 NAD(P)/FAD-dependent oxidoreductase [Lipingzhangella rawalii]
MTSQPTETPHFRVAIVGTGFAGIGMATRLKRAGVDDLVVLERADDVGGTWRDNTYPGAACDVPSHLYSLSFAPNPYWSRSFSPQPEIWDYLVRVAKDEDVMRHIRFGHEVQEARWVEQANHWHIRTPMGELTAQFLISGAGALADPALPDIPGLTEFDGPVFHSARWDHSISMRGRRVAVIGTGASAIQFVPEIQPQVDQLRVFQRTPPWVIPRHDRNITRVESWLYRNVPGAQQLARSSIYCARENYVVGFAKYPKVLKGVEALAKFNMHRHITSPQLRAKLTPNYRAGCKRILLSNDYYPALAQPNTEVITEGITEVRPHAVVTRDAAGVEHEHPVDTIILGTGFQVTDPPIAERVIGPDGTRLSEQWGEDAQAFRGTTVSGYPNLFLLLGPNTGLGHTSQVFMIESQINYTMQALKHLHDTRTDRLEVRADAQRRYNERIQENMRGTVWTSGGCDSWYLNSQGRNTTLWPTFTWRFALETRRFDEHNYRVNRREDMVA